MAMAYRELEVTLLSARELKNVNLLTRMAVYAVASISGDPLTRQCTAPDPYGGRHPCWNTTFRFAVPATAAAAAGRSLHVLLRAERALGDRDVGEVVVPLSEILAAAAGNPGPQPPRLASYQVRKVHRGKPRGALDLSYRLGPVMTPVEPPAPPAADYPRREKSNGPAPPIAVGPSTHVHTHISLGGDPTGSTNISPRTAGSPNVSPRKADGARPKQWVHQPNMSPGVPAGRSSPAAFRQQTRAPIEDRAAAAPSEAAATSASSPRRSATSGATQQPRRAANSPPPSSSAPPRVAAHFGGMVRVS